MCVAFRCYPSISLSEHRKVQSRLTDFSLDCLTVKLVVDVFSGWATPQYMNGKCQYSKTSFTVREASDFPFMKLPSSFHPNYVSMFVITHHKLNSTSDAFWKLPRIIPVTVQVNVMVYESKHKLLSLNCSGVKRHLLGNYEQQLIPPWLVSVT